MMLSLLCILRGGKLLRSSRCTVTTACGWPNSRSKNLVYPCTLNHSTQTRLLLSLLYQWRGFYGRSSVSDCESIAILNGSYHSCHCKGSPLNCSSFHWGKGPFFLLVIASASSLINDPLFGIRGAGADTCGLLQLNGVGLTKQYVGWKTGASRPGATLEAVGLGFSDVCRMVIAYQSKELKFDRLVVEN